MLLIFSASDRHSCWANSDIEKWHISQRDLKTEFWAYFFTWISDKKTLLSPTVILNDIKTFIHDNTKNLKLKICIQIFKLK